MAMVTSFSSLLGSTANGTLQQGCIASQLQQHSAQVLQHCCGSKINFSISDFQTNTNKLHHGLGLLPPGHFILFPVASLAYCRALTVLCDTIRVSAQHAPGGSLDSYTSEKTNSTKTKDYSQPSNTVTSEAT